MGFEMYAGNAHECIAHHEESIFALLEQDERRYPQLAVLRQEFYRSHRLSAQMTGDLVHELIDLLAANGGIANRPLLLLVLRLLPFFSMAYRHGVEVRCVSD